MLCHSSFIWNPYFHGNCMPTSGKGVLELGSMDPSRSAEYAQHNCCRRQPGKPNPITSTLPLTTEGTVPLENFQGHRAPYKTESSTMLLYTTAPHNWFSVLLYRLFYKFETMTLLTLFFLKVILMPTKSHCWRVFAGGQLNSPTLLIILLVLSISSYFLIIKINKLSMAKRKRDVFPYV